MSFAVIADLFVSKNIVHVAALLFLLGFLSRDQFILRGLVLLGDLLYVLYFYFAPDEPLWGGIFWSAMFTIVNIAMIWLIFFDEVDAIGGARFDDGAGGDHEVQRTMLEIVNQLDGFDARGNVKVGPCARRRHTLL